MQRLKAARTAAGLTQAQLAQQSGLHQQTISHIECGRIRVPSWTAVCRLSQALGAEPRELFPVEQVDGSAA
jgi:putative transcriptional regulator